VPFGVGQVATAVVVVLFLAGKLRPQRGDARAEGGADPLTSGDEVPERAAKLGEAQQSRPVRAI